MNALTQPAALAASHPEHQPDRLHRRVRQRAPGVAQSLQPPVYTGSVNAHRQLVMDRLKRKPFAAQAEVVQAITALLLDRNEQAGIINAEMGTGKTMMAIAVAAVMHAAGYRRTLVVSPPHLVYKWRREILETIPAARVWVLNGPDTLSSCSSCEIRWATPTTAPGVLHPRPRADADGFPLAARLLEEARRRWPTARCVPGLRPGPRGPGRQPGHGGGVRAW